MSLNEYRKKRNFSRTREPKGNEPARGGRSYLIQKHAASRLHYDFRLELDGVLLSWAVPKGPSLDPAKKCLAVHVEDHPLEYGSFEGTIPKGEYGGGTVMLWDRGTWEPEGDAAANYRRGKLIFQLHGERLKGGWVLLRMRNKGNDDGKNWLLKKLDDGEARPDDDITAELTTSVATGRSMDQIADEAKPAKQPKPTEPTERADLKIRKQSSTVAQSSVPAQRIRRAAMPSLIAPELPTLVEKIPAGPEWLLELKLDGYRLMGSVRKNKTALLTRRGHDWTPRFPTVAAALSELEDGDMIVDGEVVVLKPDGTSDFQALQNVIRQKDYDRLVYFVFDLLYHRGKDLRRVPLIERKLLLRRLLDDKNRSPVIRYSDHLSGDPDEVLSLACRHGLEGIVAKRADSPYEEGRTTDWVKVKCKKRQEFVVGGWTDPGGSRDSLGALLVGYFRGHSQLVYCGRVGTGYTESSLRELHARLRPLARGSSPFQEPPSGVAARGVIHWVKPQLVVEVEFAAWTDDAILRHASFQGIREDKPAHEIGRETPMIMNAPSKGKSHKTRNPRHQSKDQPSPANHPAHASSEDVVEGIRVTHPDRILFPDDQITKLDLAHYYAAISPMILPQIAGRPLSLVRCPSGQTGSCFYQKHPSETLSDAVHRITIKEKAGEAAYITVDEPAGLIALVQMGVLEIHPWGCRADRIERPDRLILDFDPAEDRDWADVVRAARLARARLEELGLQTFVRTTGGKGLHLVAPIARRTTWDELKDFARAFADALVREKPREFIAQSSKAKRKGKIFLDYLRNERGATAIACYSTRARPGATVATPLSWNELSESTQPGQFSVRTVPVRIKALKQDPWKGFFEVEQALTKAMLARVRAW
jgi:bifunctional non-homologous end joining protein LigD